MRRIPRFVSLQGLLHFFVPNNHQVLENALGGAVQQSLLFKIVRRGTQATRDAPRAGTFTKMIGFVRRRRGWRVGQRGLQAGVVRGSRPLGIQHGGQKGRIGTVVGACPRGIMGG